jgi:hypothetical protein
LVVEIQVGYERVKEEELATWRSPGGSGLEG